MIYVKSKGGIRVNKGYYFAESFFTYNSWTSQARSESRVIGHIITLIKGLMGNSWEFVFFIILPNLFILSLRNVATYLFFCYICHVIQIFADLEGAIKASDFFVVTMINP